MNQKRFPEEFKIEAVRQIVERGHPVAEVSARLGVSTHSLYKWMKEQQLPPGQRQEQLSQTEELRRLKAELKRVTEERDILKKAAASSTGRCNMFVKFTSWRIKAKRFSRPLI
jgi:transposase